jgi:Carboxylesterase family
VSQSSAHVYSLPQSTSDLYNFTNIRYAQPPLGELRFAAPQPPTGRNPDVQDGSVGAICPQAAPAWSPLGVAFSTAYVTGRPFNFSAAVAALQASNASTPTPDPRTNEDCLFLDVIVPKSVFDAGKGYRKRKGGKKGAAVLVWSARSLGLCSVLTLLMTAQDIWWWLHIRRKRGGLQSNWPDRG